MVPLYSLLLLYRCTDAHLIWCLLLQDGIEKEVNTVKVLLTTHHKLMSDIRAILKSLAKVMFDHSLNTNVQE